MTVFEKIVPKIIRGSKGDGAKGGRENYLIGSFIICNIQF
jgi:hypothetical protein